MNRAKTLGLSVLVAALAVTGCGKGPEPSKPGEKTFSGKEEDHPHGNGPNGGVVFDLGKYHAEFTVDHDKKEVTVLFLEDIEGKKEKEWPPQAVAAKELTLSIKETKVKEGAEKGKVVPPMTITLKPVEAKDGKASRFVGNHPGIGNIADFAGTVSGQIDGRPSSGEFKE